MPINNDKKCQNMECADEIEIILEDCMEDQICNLEQISLNEEHVKSIDSIDIVNYKDSVN